jgi:hypothetical protein
MAAGKTVAKSARRTPRGESSRQRPGKSSMGGIFPTQRPYIQPTPVVTLTFSSSDQVAIYIKNERMTVNAADSGRWKLGDDTCRTDRIDRREAETAGINRFKMVFDCSPCRLLYEQSHNASDGLGVSKSIQYTHLCLCLIIRRCPSRRKIGDECWTLDRRWLIW